MQQILVGNTMVGATSCCVRPLGKWEAVQRLCGSLQVDISKAQNLLGWTAPLSVEEEFKQVMNV